MSSLQIIRFRIEIQFTSSNGKQAVCQGNLVYHRLDEKILLQCYGTKQHRVFLLKTTDREFELYIPSHRTLYQGNIFALEDSPAIESHLRAWDLYRALKPMVIPSDNTAVASLEGGLTAVTVSRMGENPGLARDIKVSSEGDILSEVYYGWNGSISLEIQRSEFEKTGIETSGVPAVYPRNIQIISHKKTSAEDKITETVFSFKNADFLADFAESDFKIPLPENTKVMVLEDNLN